MDELKKILDLISINGGEYWSREDGNIYSPLGSSTLDTLFVLGETGLADVGHPTIAAAVEFIFSYQSLEGAFRYRANGSKHPCITARIIAGLGRLKVVHDERIEKSYRYFLPLQQEDGGWRCNTVKKGRSLLWDASNPGATLFVIDAFRFRENTPEEKIMLDRGVDFLLQHWDVKIPIGPCQFGIGTRFMQVEYPFMRYNLFYYVYVLSFYKEAIGDRRFQEAYHCLKNKTQNGEMIVEAPHKWWQQYDFAKKGKSSQAATLRWKEIERNVTL